MGRDMKRLRALWHRIARASRARAWRRMTDGREKVRIDLEDGAFLEAPAASDLARMIFVDELEAEERKIIRKLLRPGDFFIDVGANFGLYSIVAGRCVGGEGAVWAFEPASATFASLQRNLDLNQLPQVRAQQAAISDFDGEASMKVSLAGRDGWNTLGVSLHDGSHGTETVSCLKLDTVMETQMPARRPAMMKLDVEGWEWHVLRGAENLLARSDAPMLQVEFAPAYFTANGESIDALRDEITRHGYELYAMTGEAGLRRFDEGRDELAGNLFAVKPGAPWRDRFDAILDKARSP